jgi:NTE family protein
MTRTVEVMFKKVQDATMNRLHQQVASQSLAGFILPYLGQNDTRLPYSSPDLLPRDAVCDYPTNFDAMSSETLTKSPNEGNN